MTTRLVPGQTMWSRDDDEEGYRNYTISFQTIGDSTDGPNAHSQTVGLPRAGQPWNWETVIDQWAFRTNGCSIRQRAQRGPNTVFDHEFKYTTKPFKRCNDTPIENPLLEPVKVSGSYTKYMEEGILDRQLRPIVNSAWEHFRGQQNEWDANRPQINIEHNVLRLELELFNWMVDCVNDRQLWGLPRRCIKLSAITWEELWYGQCFKYYKRKYTFDINFKTWDRFLQDEGTKVLNGHWTKENHWKLDLINGERPNRWNPAHFIAAVDYKGNPIPIVLNGFGLPAGSCIDDIDITLPAPSVEYYVNWLGIPEDPVVGIFPVDKRAWIRTTKPIPTVATAEVWSNKKVYHPGDFVKRNEAMFIAYGASLGSDPGKPVAAANQPGNWIGAPAFGYVNKGLFDRETEYVNGDYVTANKLVSTNTETGTGTPPECTPTQIGQIFVEKYSEVNLLELGIPAIIGR